jgi:hypothetical protein
MDRASQVGISNYMVLWEIALALGNYAESGSVANLSLLPTLLWKFRGRLATDPRDMIYSLLGLLDIYFTDAGIRHPLDARRLKLEKLLVDYDTTVEDVYASLVDAVVSATESLNIICASQSPNRFTRTWIPDWTEPWKHYSFLTTNMYLNFQYLKHSDAESYSASASMAASISFTNNKHTLKVDGIEWD